MFVVEAFAREGLFLFANEFIVLFYLILYCQHGCICDSLYSQNLQQQHGLYPEAGTLSPRGGVIVRYV